MNEPTINRPPEADEAVSEKPGFFARIFARLDKAMKEKSEQSAQKGSCCCSENKDDGGKCC